MPPTGAAKPIFYFIGEAPGKNEDEDGEQFVGESGQLIRSKIPSKWVNTIRWNNTIRCFVSWRVMVLTATGYKAIAKIKVGELVLTHKGRFKPVTSRIHDLPKEDRAYTGNLYQVKVFPQHQYSKSYLTKPVTQTVTEDHQFQLLDGSWKKVSNLRNGDQIRVLSSPCESCGREIFTRNVGRVSKVYCSTTCYNREANKLASSRGSISRGLRKSYLVGTRNGTRITEKAHKRNKQLAAEGKLTLQNLSLKTRWEARLKALTSETFSKNSRIIGFGEKRLFKALADAGFSPKSQERLIVEKDHRLIFYDLFIPDLKLLIEIDGPGHNNNGAWRNDRYKNKVAKLFDYQILRVPHTIKNEDILKAVRRIQTNHDGKYTFTTATIKIKKYKAKRVEHLYCLAVDTDESFIANGVVHHNCRPTVDNAGQENREPAALEIACCRRLQVSDIERTKPKVLVGFGGMPLNWVLGPDKDGDEKKIIPWRGRRMPVKIGNHTCWFYPITHPEAVINARKNRRMYEATVQTFHNDLKRVFTDYVEGLPLPEVESPEDYYRGIRTIEEYTRTGFNDVLRWLSSQAKLDNSTIDIETSELRPYNKTSRILSCAIGTYEGTLAFPLEHVQAKWSASQLKQIYAALEAYLLSPGHKCAHFAKFEQEWMVHKYGPRIVHEVAWEDTGAAAHALDERKGKALENLTEMHFGFNVKRLSGLDTKKLDTYPLSDVLKYNALDTKYTDALRRVLFTLLEEQGLMSVYEEINHFTPSFTLMQARGVHRNIPVIEQFSKDLLNKKEDILLKISENKDVQKFIPVNGKFKPTSNPDVQKFFRDFLKVPHPNRAQRNFSKYSLTEDILAQIKHPIAAALLDLRTTTGNLSKYVEPLLDEPSTLFPDGGRYVCGDGLAHATFTQLITSTGRSSCENPPLQQWPKREHREIRRVICAPPGCRMVSFDFGQLEARIIGMLSKDPVLSKEVFANYDIHGDWTDRLGKAFDPSTLKTKESRKHLRDYIKNKWTFPLFFGSALDSVAYDLCSVFDREVSPSVLEPYYQEFWDKYRVVLDWQERLEAFYWKHGYVETAFGFRRHEPLSKNEIVNSPVQGTAAQLVMDAQARLSKAAYTLEKPQYQTVINMHDDLVSCLPTKTIEEDVEFIAKEMCVFDRNFVTLPLSIEVSVGSNWADQEEIGTFYSTDFGWQPPTV